MRAPSGYLTRNYIIHKYITLISLRRTCTPCGFTMKIRHLHCKKEILTQAVWVALNIYKFLNSSKKNSVTNMKCFIKIEPVFCIRYY